MRAGWRKRDSPPAAAPRRAARGRTRRRRDARRRSRRRWGTSARRRARSTAPAASSAPPTSPATSRTASGTRARSSRPYPNADAFRARELREPVELARDERAERSQLALVARDDPGEIRIVRRILEQDVVGHE